MAGNICIDPGMTSGPGGKTRMTPRSETSRLRATAIGGIAVLLWAGLAVLTKLAGPVPPLQLEAMSFGIAGAASVIFWAIRGGGILARLCHPPAVWLLGIGGLFGYHFLFFLALGAAPAVEVNLLNYTWPLLIVLFSGLLPGERLRWWHVAGVLIGLVGAVQLVTRGFTVTLGQGQPLGYLAAFGGALVWSGYSVLSRRFGAVSSDAIGGFCLGTAVLATFCHALIEPTLWPVGGIAWLAVLGLGLGPVGVAFFAWDYGVKHGNIKALGGMSYAAPLLSTLLLIGAGMAPATPAVALACLAIIGGAFLTARDLWARAMSPA
jgi:drug/metabolite transporter (DMT)-like permease